MFLLLLVLPCQTDGLGDNVHPSEMLLLLAEGRKQLTPKPLTPPASPSTASSIISSATSAVSSILPSSLTSSSLPPTPPATPTAEESPSQSVPAKADEASHFAQQYAEALSRYARLCMHEHEKVSPFTLAAAKEGLDYMGGKVDEYVWSSRVTAAMVKRLWCTDR